MKRIIFTLLLLCLGLSLFTLNTFSLQASELFSSQSFNPEFKKEISQNEFDSKLSTINLKDIFPPKPAIKIQAPIENSKPTTAIALSPAQNKLVSASQEITISKIGLINTPLAVDSLTTSESLYSKLLYYPVVENVVSPELCSSFGNSYIYGHSEPPSKKESGFPASKIFSNLEAVEAGDIIEIKASEVKKCSYRVTKMDSITTTADQKVDGNTFNFAYFPVNEKPMLTIQTCLKGSSVTRLLLRAELIS